MYHGPIYPPFANLTFSVVCRPNENKRCNKNYSGCESRSLFCYLTVPFGFIFVLYLAVKHCYMISFTEDLFQCPNSLKPEWIKYLSNNILIFVYHILYHPCPLLFHNKNNKWQNKVYASRLILAFFSLHYHRLSP